MPTKSLNNIRLQRPIASSWNAYPYHPLKPSKPSFRPRQSAGFYEDQYLQKARLYLFVDLYLLSTYNAWIIRVEISFDPTLRLESSRTSKVHQHGQFHFGNALVEFNSFTDKEAIRMWDTITHHLRSELQKRNVTK